MKNTYLIKTTWILALVVLILGLSSCASKRYAKKGKEFESAGLYKEAADMYYESVVRKPDRVEAQVGLKKNGQMALTKMLADFNKFCFDEQDKDAVYKYNEAKDFNNKINNVGVQLIFPQHHEEEYTVVKERYLSKRYNDATAFLDEEKFKEAEEIFTEIQKFEPDYYDVDELKKTAYSEPRLRKGNDQMLDGKYRSAYRTYSEVLSKYDSYKDVSSRRDEALDKATLTIAVMSFKNNSRGGRGLEKQLNQQVISSLNSLKNPFIKIVEYETKQLVTQAQIAALENPGDGKINIETGKLLGAKAMLTGEIFINRMDEEKPTETKVKAYIKEVKKVTKDGVTTEVPEYHKVKYKEITASNNVSISFSFRVISLETGEIMLAKTINSSKSDKIHYATFDGDYKKLVPGFWEDEKSRSPKDQVNDKESEVNELRRVFKAEKNIQSLQNLTQEALNEISKSTAKQIDNYDPEKN